MATIISIAYEESDEAVARVSQLLDEVVRTDCDWNGASFKVVRGEFTCMPGKESYEAVTLFHKIQHAIAGHEWRSL